jgi:hypothetical protein
MAGGRRQHPPGSRCLLRRFGHSPGSEELDGSSGYQRDIRLPHVRPTLVASLTERDRAYLKALETWLDMYPEMRTE